MSRKSPFAPEPATKPATSRSRREAPTVPPPAKRRASEDPGASTDGAVEEDPRTAVTPKTSTVRPKRRSSIPAATVDEVTADLRKDPRRED